MNHPEMTSSIELSETTRIPQPVPHAGSSSSSEVLSALIAAELTEMGDLTPSGLLKWILEPLSYTIVYFVMVGLILDHSQFAFPFFLMCALVPWKYFTGVTLRSMGLVGRYAAIITNHSFDKRILPLVLMSVEGATLLVAMCLFGPLMLYYEIPPSPALLWVPVVLAALALLTSGPAYLMTLLGIYHPDYKSVVQNLIRMGFFVSAGLVPAETEMSDGLETLLRANPLTGIFESFRAIFIYGHAPHAFDLLYPMGVGLVVLAVALALYRHWAPDFVKKV
jgi:lipopolysaccharide transport system permease protein